MSELFDMDWLVCGVGRITSDHLLVLAEWNTLALDLLDVFETRKDVVLDDECSLHLVFATLLDGEWLSLQRFQSTWLGEVNGDISSAFDFLWKD